MNQGIKLAEINPSGSFTASNFTLESKIRSDLGWWLRGNRSPKNGSEPISALVAWSPRRSCEVTSDGGSEAIGFQGINPSQILALIDPAGQYIGVQFPRSRHPRSPHIQESEAIMMAVLALLLTLDQFLGVQLPPSCHLKLPRMPASKINKLEVLLPQTCCSRSPRILVSKGNLLAVHTMKSNKSLMVVLCPNEKKRGGYPVFSLISHYWYKQNVHVVRLHTSIF